jgi:hypothetical protein
MAKKYHLAVRKIDQMAIKFTINFHCKGTPKFTKIGISLFENVPSGNPDSADEI